MQTISATTKTIHQVRDIISSAIIDVPNVINCFVEEDKIIVETSTWIDENRINKKLIPFTKYGYKIMVREIRILPFIL